MLFFGPEAKHRLKSLCSYLADSTILVSIAITAMSEGGATAIVTGVLTIGGAILASIIDSLDNKEAREGLNDQMSNFSKLNTATNNLLVAITPTTTLFKNYGTVEHWYVVAPAIITSLSIVAGGMLCIIDGALAPTPSLRNISIITNTIGLALYKCNQYLIRHNISHESKLYKEGIAIIVDAITRAGGTQNIAQVAPATPQILARQRTLGC